MHILNYLLPFTVCIYSTSAMCRYHLRLLSNGLINKKLADLFDAVLAVRAAWVDRHDVRPVGELEQFHDDARLVPVARYNAREILVLSLVAQNVTGGVVAQLGNLKDTHQFPDVHASMAEGSTDHAQHGITRRSQSLVPGAVLRCWNKLRGAAESGNRRETIVQDHWTEGDIGQ